MRHLRCASLEAAAISLAAILVFLTGCERKPSAPGASVDSPRVFFKPAILTRGSGNHFNAKWSVPDKGAAIIQSPPHSIPRS